MVYFDLERTQDLLVILDLCDRIFWGISYCCYFGTSYVLVVKGQASR